MSEEWSTPGKAALVLSLVKPRAANDQTNATGLQTLATFHPNFTYAIFGDDEQIFGYQGLKINLKFNANDMRPNLTVSYSKRFQSIGETEPTDIKGILKDFLPEVAFQGSKDYETAVKTQRKDWTPPGQLFSTFCNDGSEYEVWAGNLADPVVKQLISRIQIFVLLFIDGGSFLGVDEPDADRWTVFLLYQKKQAFEEGLSSYIFSGYSTVYRFFYFQAPTFRQTSVLQHDGDEKREPTLGDGFDLTELPCRTRISQFLILPPFQNKGLGPILYNAIYQRYLEHAQTVEITVEDPSEPFDDMRDLADLHFLRQQPEFQALHVNTTIIIPKKGKAPTNIIDKVDADKVRAKFKIAPRQFFRVLEIHLMSTLPTAVRPCMSPEKRSSTGTDAEKHQHKLWRLLVKQRIYRQNKDQLGQLKMEERIKKLEETVCGVEFDYTRLLIKLEGQEKRWSLSGPTQNLVGAKRRLEDGELPSAKKARVAQLQ